MVNESKNLERELPSFANINLLGKCNVKCFFCLGLNVKEYIDKYDHNSVHFSRWKNFEYFLGRCRDASIRNIYITGQNTDALLYAHLDDLITYLKASGFRVGLRTNGYKAVEALDTINKCDLSVGYSMHAIRSTTNHMIMGRKGLPDWTTVLHGTNNPRVSIVVNRCNRYEFFDILKYLRQFDNIRYVQARKVSTIGMSNEFIPDIKAYDSLYRSVYDNYKVKKVIWRAEVFEIFGMDVVFWRTTATSVNSYNYFTDGTVSEEYFIVDGYLKNMCSTQDKKICF